MKTKIISKPSVTSISSNTRTLINRIKKSAVILIILLAASVTQISAQAQTEEQKIFPDETNVKLLGRTMNKNKTLWFTQSASGIEFKVKANTLKVELQGDSTARATRGKGDTNKARYEIYVDDELLTTGTMAKRTVEETIFDRNASDEPKTATVRIIKITEAPQSHMGINSIILDKNGTISPTPEKSIKIEFIGDSITCGYGNEATTKDSFSTATENSSKAFAYLTAKALDADYSLVSYSGFGIISGYSAKGSLNSSGQFPPLYENTTYSWTTQDLNSEKWDFKKFIPDAIVINLGTNDESYTRGETEKCEEFKKGYIEFIKKIRANNESSAIICTYGMSSDALYPYVEKAVEEYTAETKDTNVAAFHFTPHNPSVDGAGADWHPSVKSHEKAAKALTAYLKEIFF